MSSTQANTSWDTTRCVVQPKPFKFDLDPPPEYSNTTTNIKLASDSTPNETPNQTQSRVQMIGYQLLTSLLEQERAMNREIMQNECHLAEYRLWKHLAIALIVIFFVAVFFAVIHACIHLLRKH